MADDGKHMGGGAHRGLFTGRAVNRLEISPSFYLFWAVFCLMDTECVLPVFLLAAVLHECGHAAAILLLGGRIAQLRLCAAGAELVQARQLSCLRTCVIALAGPLAGLLAAGCCALIGRPVCAGANLLLSMLNLLPILPLDGGCAVKQLLLLLPPTAAAIGVRALTCFSVLASVGVTMFGGALLYQTGRNAAVLIIGICLLRYHRTSLRGTGKYGMITIGQNG